MYHSSYPHITSYQEEISPAPQPQPLEAPTNQPRHQCKRINTSKLKPCRLQKYHINPNPDTTQPPCDHDHICETMQTPIIIQASIISPKTENETETPNSPVAYAPPHDAAPSHAPQSNAHQSSPPDTPAQNCGNETLSTFPSAACRRKNCERENVCAGITLQSHDFAPLCTPAQVGNAIRTSIEQPAPALFRGTCRVCHALCGLSPCRDSHDPFICHPVPEVLALYPARTPSVHSELPSHLSHLSHLFHLCHLFPFRPFRPFPLCPPWPYFQDTPWQNARCVYNESTPHSADPVVQIPPKLHSHAFAEQFILVELPDGGLSLLEHFELNEGEVVESVLVFLDVQFVDAPVLAEQRAQLSRHRLLGLAPVDVRHEDLTPVLGLRVAGLALRAGTVWSHLLWGLNCDLQIRG